MKKSILAAVLLLLAISLVSPGKASAQVDVSYAVQIFRSDGGEGEVPMVGVEVIFWIDIDGDGLGQVPFQRFTDNAGTASVQNIDVNPFVWANGSWHYDATDAADPGWPDPYDGPDDLESDADYQEFGVLIDPY